MSSEYDKIKATINSEWVDVILTTPYGDDESGAEENIRMRILEFAIDRGLINNVNI